MKSPAYWTSSGIFYTVYLAFFISTLGFIIDIPVSKWALPTAILLSIALVSTFQIKNKISKLQIFSTLAWILVIFVFSLLASKQFFDISWDGQVYHQEAVIQLNNGWNPLQEKVSSKILPNKSMVAQINYFPKLLWITNATIYQLTDSIETAKSTNFLLFIATLLLVFSALKTGFQFSNRLAIILSLVAVLNPVVIGQLFTFYVDGNLYLLFVSFLASASILLKAPNDSAHWLLSFILLLTLANTKFSGAVFASVLAIPGLFYLKKYIVWIYHNVKKTLLIASSLLFVTTTNLYDPYINNYLSKNHIFYPVMGETTYNIGDVAKESGPANFKKLNQYERLFQSLYSKTLNDMKGTSQLKLPFTLDNSEYFYIKGADPRVAGLGPLFSGALSLSLFPLLLLYLGLWRPGQRNIAITASLLIAVTVLLHPAAWWARFVPQLYLIPFLIVILLNQSSAFYTKMYGWLIAVSLLFNAAYSLIANFQYNSVYTGKINKQIADFQSNRKAHSPAYFDNFRSNRARLKEAGIQYTELPHNRLALCNTRVYIVKSMGHLCISSTSLRHR